MDTSGNYSSQTSAGDQQVEVQISACVCEKDSICACTYVQ